MGKSALSDSSSKSSQSHEIIDLLVLRKKNQMAGEKTISLGFDYSTPKWDINNKQRTKNCQILSA